MKILSPFLLIVLLSACQSKTDINDLPINHIQVIGSHNSYKRAIDPKLFKVLEKRDSVGASKIDYSHISLSGQLNLGLHSLEIDVHADPQGGRYAHPKGLDWVKEQSPYDPDSVMLKPGFKVFHIKDIDFRSNCLTFKNCLIELKKWSSTHPEHYPIFITMNEKDKIKKGPAGIAKFEKIFDRLDSSILKGIGREKLIIPDDIRGSYKTLESAVLHDNWPKVEDAKGKFIFILDEIGEKRKAYIKDHPSLKGRVAFINAEPGTPEAAILIRNNPKTGIIEGLVRKGYIVRTRADANTEEARRNDYSRFKAACKSGAQIITTDYYKKSTHFNSDYKVAFKYGKYKRIDPLFIKK